jgi:hypothetical protein
MAHQRNRRPQERKSAIRAHFPTMRQVNSPWGFLRLHVVLCPGHTKLAAVVLAYHITVLLFPFMYYFFSSPIGRKRQPTRLR